MGKQRTMADVLKAALRDDLPTIKQRLAERRILWETMEKPSWVIWHGAPLLLDGCQIGVDYAADLSIPESALNPEEAHP